MPYASIIKDKSFIQMTHLENRRISLNTLNSMRIKMKSSARMDMTQGPIMRKVLVFALPICAGNVLQQLYSTVDTVVIGNFCGSTSLAAVGTSSQPVELLLCIFLGIGTGVSILVSQFVGNGNEKKLREIMETSVFFLYMCAIPLSVAGQFIGPLVLKIMQVPEDTWAPAVSYIAIIFWGTLGNMGYNMNAGILRGLGDSRASLLFLVISCDFLRGECGSGSGVRGGLSHGCGGSRAGDDHRHVLLLAVQHFLHTQAVPVAWVFLSAPQDESGDAGGDHPDRPAAGAEQLFLLHRTYSHAVAD